MDILPDDVLLCIFNVYVNESLKTEEWHTLVHVCRRWRTVVFGSPHHLNLQLLCTSKRPVTKKLNIWPALPIVVEKYLPTSRLDNIIAALEHNADRVLKINLRLLKASPELENVVAVMEEPFRLLTFLSLILHGEIHGADSIIPNSFLGGSAPRLEHLRFDGIPFPGLPSLVSSAPGLVYLELRRIPNFGYISPDVMVTCLSALTCLKTLIVEFVSPFPEWETPRDPLSPSPTRILLPAVTRLKLKTSNKYVENVMIRIDTPLFFFF
jgi:hypothetical protein